MVQKLLYKFLGLFTILMHRKVDPSLRYFYRDTYLCQLSQIRYVIRDYIFKTKYKIISFEGEFAPELQFVLPFAYWHYKNGTLKATRSSKYTKELYFFSDCHEEIYDARSNEGNYNFEIPRILYSHDYNMKKWLAVPLKDQYKNDIYVYDKPLLIIANRYNMEWNGPPVSFLDIPLLNYIIEKLGERYTIVYNRPQQTNIITDDSDLYDLQEYSWLKSNHPRVLLMEDLFRENLGKARNFNHLQLLVYANAERFISTHGGTATLASYFGGTNLILSKKGPEHHFKCYEKLYPKFSGAKIYHAKTDEELKALIQAHYLNEASYATPR